MARRFAHRMFVFMLLAHLAIGGQTVGIAFAAGGSEGGATETNGGERYLELESMTVTIFRNDAPAGQLTTRLTVLVPSSEAYATVKDGRLKLRDAMFRELLRMVEREARNGPVVDLDLVKKRMLKVSRRQFGADNVADIFVQAFIRRGA